MDIRFLGVGGAFDPEFGSSAAVVDTGGGTHTLIDCGCTTYGDLRRAGLTDKVTHVLITHLHDDHCGSLGNLINHHFHISQNKLVVAYPPGLEQPLRALLELQRTNRPLEQVMHFEPLTAETLIGETRVEFIDTSGRHQVGMPSYAYVLKRGDEVISYSGDIADPDLIFRELEQRGYQSALVCHDATFGLQAKGSHVHYKDLERWAGEWNIRIYHHRPDQKPTDCKLRMVYEDEAMKPLFY